MNWIDIIMIFILIYTMIKGLGLGLMLSIFNIVQVILSVIITKRYYPYIYGYIINNPKVYNIFKGITQLILKILFYSKNKEDTNFIPELISKGLLKINVNLPHPQGNGASCFFDLATYYLHRLNSDSSYRILFTGLRHFYF